MGDDEHNVVATLMPMSEVFGGYKQGAEYYVIH